MAIQICESSFGSVIRISVEKMPVHVCSIASVIHVGDPEPSGKRCCYFHFPSKAGDWRNFKVNPYITTHHMGSRKKFWSILWKNPFFNVCKHTDACSLDAYFDKKLAEHSFFWWMEAGKLFPIHCKLNIILRMKVWRKKFFFCSDTTKFITIT